MERIYYILIIIFLILAAVAIGLGIGLAKDKSSSGGGPSPSPVIEQWVAVGNDGGGLGNIMYSPDGKTWTDSGPAGASFSSHGVKVAYGTDSTGDPLWVAAGSGGGGFGSIMYSPDGQSWTQPTTGASFNNYGNGAAYGTSNGTSPLWVAVGNDVVRLGNIMYSPDGQSWTQPTTGASFSILGFDVAYGTSNGTSPLWVAVGYGGGFGSIMYSPDGKTWIESDPAGDSFFSYGTGVAYGTSSNGEPLWVAVGYDVLGGGGTSFGNIMYSPDGKTWTKTTTGASFGVLGHGVAYGNSSNGDPLWVAVGGDGGGGLGNIMYSPDGQTWTKPTTGDSFDSTGAGTDVAYGTSSNGDPFWVAVGDDGGFGSIMYSPDGQSWTQTTTGASFSDLGYGVASTTANPAFL